MTKKKRGAIYARKSRENAATLEGQINSCKEFCTRYEIDFDLFIEEGSASSEDWNRPKLQELIKAIRKYDYEYIVVSEQTRISRTEDFFFFQKLLKETGTILCFADTNETVNYLNPMDKVKSGIQQIFGGYELDTAKIRLKRGTVQSAKDGNWQGKKAPVGYDYDPPSKKLVKNNDAPVIERMFDLYINGESTVGISHIFINENVVVYHKKKGEKVPVTWGKSTVSRMLQNITYAGHTLFGKTKVIETPDGKKKVPNDPDQQILIEGTHKAIVDPEVWKKAQQLMKERRTIPPALKIAKHSYSGLITCPNCKRHHSFERGQNGYWRVSSCQTRVYNEAKTKYKICGNSGCDIRKFETLFNLALLKIRSELDDCTESIKKAKNLDATQKIKERKKDSKELQLKKLERKRANILDNIEEGLYEKGKELDEKKKQTKEILEDINQLKIEIEEMAIVKEETELEIIERVKNNIDKVLSGQTKNMDELEINKILTTFIHEITYRKPDRNSLITVDVVLKPEYAELIKEIKKDGAA